MWWSASPAPAQKARPPARLITRRTMLVQRSLPAINHLSSTNDGYPALSMECPVCEDRGLVCDINPDQPREGPRACALGGAGAPSRDCTRFIELQRPAKGFHPDQGD